MKKIFFVFMLIYCSYSANAQSVVDKILDGQEVKLESYQYHITNSTGFEDKTSKSSIYINKGENKQVEIYYENKFMILTKISEPHYDTANPFKTKCLSFQVESQQKKATLLFFDDKLKVMLKFQDIPLSFVFDLNK